MATVPSIPEFYSGRKIFITGGSGFMGKVLIEKLLRSCPDLHTVFLLIRPKKGKRFEERILDITKQSLFDTIRQDDPSAFEKLHAISGDVRELGLGLCAEDKELLQREVSVVFHSAASVRFTDNINDSVLMNVRGTREVVNLALGMVKLQVFEHVSTAFSNVCDRGHVDEKVYPPPRGWDWRTAIKLAEMEGTDSFVNCLTPKILGPFLPNSYVFTKGLAEQLINDHQERLPLIIVRPSIVVGAFEEPLRGWIDNLNGPYGFWILCYTGVLRTMFSKVSVRMDFVPVDAAVKSMVAIAWHRGISKLRSELAVYNCASLLEPISQGAFTKDLAKMAVKYPTTKMAWYPRCDYVGSWAYFYFCLLVFHIPHGILLDLVMKYKDMKPMFVQIYRRLYTGLCEMRNFSNINYTFGNSELLRLADEILVADRKEFGYTGVRRMDEQGFEAIILGIREHLVKDPLVTIPEARRSFTRWHWLDRTVKGASCLALLWVLTSTGVFHSLTSTFAQ